MYAQVERLKENKGRAAANYVAQKKGNTKQDFGIMDNRQEAIQMMKLSNMARHDRHSKHLSGMSTIQRVCYSVNNGGTTHQGNTEAGADFTNQGNYFQNTNLNLNFLATHTGIDALTGNTLIPHSLAMPLIGHVDHIVPANLGGGPVESNGRLIDARTNTSRKDNFKTSAGPWTVDNIVIVADNNQAYTTVSGAKNYGGASIVALQNLHDKFPAIWGPTKRFKTSEILGKKIRYDGDRAKATSRNTQYRNIKNSF
jgi:hypothetical protein